MCSLFLIHRYEVRPYFVYRCTADKCRVNAIVNVVIIYIYSLYTCYSMDDVSVWTFKLVIISDFPYSPLPPPVMYRCHDIIICNRIAYRQKNI